MTPELEQLHSELDRLAVERAFDAALELATHLRSAVAAALEASDCDPLVLLSKAQNRIETTLHNARITRAAIARELEVTASVSRFVQSAPVQPREPRESHLG